MRPEKLNYILSSISSLKGVGPKLEQIINKLGIYEFMSFSTYYMHLIFGRIPSLMSSDLILYILPALTISILFFSLKIMFFKTPKLRKVK